ncbi:MAG: S-methyl-5-thioribose-1-phosphate isomerase [Candidatus ainarchaeum sp.]|nr:S-methyl-5-thioribose-1-phosphate isomerase [Candidatus ainarchaeum sp.]
MDKEIERIIDNIKSLKIQGARNVAKAVLNAIILQIKNSKAKSFDSLYSELLVVTDALASARPTEPMVRNSIKDMVNFTFMHMKKEKSIESLKKKIVSKSKSYLDDMKEDAENLWQYGSRLIENGNVIMTHCHSSTVTGVLKKANELGKNFQVIACETRPRFQGRITAKDLSENGIDTTLIVDGGMNSFMRKVDLCIVGADAIDSTGNLINKIGTSTLAQIARAHNVPFYCAAELYKYNPLTLYGNREIIEERDSKEVWDNPPKKLKVRNPAFDITEARYINAYITEGGLIPPHSFLAAFNKKLGLR